MTATEYDLVTNVWPLHKLKHYMLVLYVRHFEDEMRAATQDFKQKINGWHGQHA